MNAIVAKPKLPIEWHAADKKAPAQMVSGDMCLIQPFKGGLLLAVVDGVGHGAEAIAATTTAVTVLKQHAKDSVIALVQRCHEALQGTRGVVMTLASLHAGEGTLTWIGVGNVEGRLMRADHGHPSENVLLLRGGLVGYRLPALHASVLPIVPDDLLIFASDGIYPGFDAVVTLGAPPRVIAERILNDYYKGTDDAAVLVVRYLGRQPVSRKLFPGKAARPKPRTNPKP